MIYAWHNLADWFLILAAAAAGFALGRIGRKRK